MICKHSWVETTSTEFGTHLICQKCDVRFFIRGKIFTPDEWAARLEDERNQLSLFESNTE